MASRPLRTSALVAIRTEPLTPEEHAAALAREEALARQWEAELRGGLDNRGNVGAVTEPARTKASSTGAESLPLSEVVCRRRSGFGRAPGRTSSTFLRASTMPMVRME